MRSAICAEMPDNSCHGSTMDFVLEQTLSWLFCLHCSNKHTNKQTRRRRRSRII